MLYDIWPNAKLPSANCQWDSVQKLTEDVEHICMNFLDNKYEAVLFPSARSAIYHIILTDGFKRNDSVCVSEWSSHCVIEAISRIAMPNINLIDSSTKGMLINHQWGYVKSFRGGYHGIIIEDSCDSLIENKDSLFPNDGDFEIFSFPKIFGSLAGGVCICRNKKSAYLLKEARERDSRQLAEKQYHLKSRYVSTKEQIWLEYFAGAEAINGWLTAQELIQILFMMNDIDHIFAQRKERCREFQKEGLLNKVEGRFPVAIPLKYSNKIDRSLQQAGLELPVRHFNVSENAYETCFKRCVVVPIHQDVCDNKFYEIISIIKKNGQEK